MTVRHYGSIAVVTGLYREKGLKNGKPYPAPGAIHRYLGAQKQDLDMRRQPVNTSPIVTRLIGGVAIPLTPIRH